MCVKVALCQLNNKRRYDDDDDDEVETYQIPRPSFLNFPRLPLSVSKFYH